MDVTYGKGVYLEGTTHLEGEIILGDHKLFLKSKDGDLPSSYIPLEKIREVKKITSGFELFVKQTISHSYRAMIRGEAALIKELLKEIVTRRGLTKKFLQQVWFDTEE